jgi:hypothetical protein
MNRPMVCLLGWVLTVAAVTGCVLRGLSDRTGESGAPAKLDVIFVATDLEIVNAMLKLANVTRNDVVYVLG